MSRDRSRSPPGGGRSKVNFDDLHSVRIGNDLPESVQKDDLRDKFSKYGDIGDIFIPVDGSTQRSRGFAFVRFYEKRDMEDCLDDLKDGIDILGKDCKVEFIRPRDRRDRGFGGRDRGRDRDYYRDDRRDRGGWGDRRGGGGYGHDDRDRRGYGRDRSRSRSRSRDRRRY